MRPSNKNRSRNKNNNRRAVGNVTNRVFDSSGPEGKVRGTPQQIIEKYTSYARDAQLSGDRVAAENFQQHAEHFIRMLAEAARETAEQRAQQEAQQNRQRHDRDDHGGNGQDFDQSRSQDHDRQARDGGNDADQIAEPAKSDDSGLVETPESKPSRRRGPPRSRAPRAAREEAAAPQDPPAQD